MDHRVRAVERERVPTRLLSIEHGGTVAGCVRQPDPVPGPLRVNPDEKPRYLPERLPSLSAGEDLGAEREHLLIGPDLVQPPFPRPPVRPTGPFKGLPQEAKFLAAAISKFLAAAKSKFLATTVTRSDAGVVCHWPSAATGWILQTSDDLVSWQDAPEDPILTDGRFEWSEPDRPGQSRRFFRLILP
jgi:hypothetical protein